MTCIIVDDEPLAREGIELLINKVKDLTVVGSFSNATAAAKFLASQSADIVFLDIQMPGTNGLEFARSVPPETLVIFTTAYVEYALDSYEVEAIDYLVKPVKLERFQKAVDKAAGYIQLLRADNSSNNIKEVADDYFFIKADRRVFKVYFDEILFVEGLKDYVVLQTKEQKIVTAMNIKTIYDQLPQNIFVRVSKSYLINIKQVTSFDNNLVFINKYEIPIGNAYRTYFFDEFVSKKLLKR